jgi:hypothetical protein
MDRGTINQNHRDTIHRRIKSLASGESGSGQQTNGHCDQRSGTSVRNLIKLSLFDRVVVIDCRDGRAASLVRANYGAFEVQSDHCHLRYLVVRDETADNLIITRNNRETLVVADDDDFLYLLEKDLTIELQKLRRDLYFLHAAALRFNNQAILLVAPSGVGKSTTTWALLHHGFEYLSDELAPLDLATRAVFPYPHAICLKQPPPAPFLLPAGTVDAGRTLHVPIAALPNRHSKEPTPLGAIYFLERADTTVPTFTALRTAEAAARMYVNALNPLAHPGEGLDAAIELARNSYCFELRLGDLSATAMLAKKLTEETVPSQQSQTWAS